MALGWLWWSTSFGFYSKQCALWILPEVLFVTPSVEWMLTMNGIAASWNTGWLHMIKMVHFSYSTLAEVLQMFFCLFPVHCNFLIPLALNSGSVVYAKGFPSVWSVNFRSVTSQTLCLVLVPFSFWSSQSVHPWRVTFLLPLCPFWKNAGFLLIQAWFSDASWFLEWRGDGIIPLICYNPPLGFCVTKSVLTA